MPNASIEVGYNTLDTSEVHQWGRIFSHCLSSSKERTCCRHYHRGETKADDLAVQEDPQAAQEPNEEGSKESDEGSEDDDEEEEDMEEGDGNKEQHARMLAEVRAAGRPAGARRPREVQTESVPERALNVGPMTDLPGKGPSVQHIPAQARQPASLHSQAFTPVPGLETVFKPSFRCLMGMASFVIILLGRASIQIRWTYLSAVL